MEGKEVASCIRTKGDPVKDPRLNVKASWIIDIRFIRSFMEAERNATQAIVSSMGCVGIESGKGS